MSVPPSDLEQVDFASDGRRSRSDVVKVVLAALIGVAWAGRRLRRTYFYFDEWSMIGRVTQYGPLEGATTSFNGHLWFFQDMIFRIQVRLFGLDSNAFLVVTFLCALVALHLTLAAVAVRVGVPLTLALLLGGLLTYLGPAAQNFVFTIQLSPTFATAAGLGATAVVLGGPPTLRRSAVVSGLLLIATLFDSGVGLLALALGGGAVLGLWPRRQWWVLAPSVFVTGLWYAFGDLGPTFEASTSDRVEFAGRLIVRGAGAVAGGGAWVGSVVLVLFAAAAIVAALSGRLERAGWTIMLAAGAATAINVVGISQSRGGLDGFSFFENNRYLQNVAIPLSITFLPALVVCAGLVTERWTPAGRGAKRALRALPVIIVSACFVSGLDEERDYADVFIDRTERVRAGVDDIAVVRFAGCPSGVISDPDVRPLGSLSPQVSVRLVGDLVDRDALTVPGVSFPVDAGLSDPYDVDPEIRRRICDP